MNRLLLTLLLLCTLALPTAAQAQNAQADSIDVEHYTLSLDLGHQTPRTLQGYASLLLHKTRACDTLSLDLCEESTIDSVLINSTAAAYRYDADNQHLLIAAAQYAVGQSINVTIYYRSTGHVESYGWGGFHFDNSLYYNLGVAFREYPNVFGRSWFPCRDNLYDKATFRLAMTCKPGWQTLCSGVRVSQQTNADQSVTSVWDVNQPIPTYLVGVAAAPWSIIESSVAGLERSYDAIYGHTSGTDENVRASFNILDDALPMYERCFGPYSFERIGYVQTTQGSMEHVANIALTTHCNGAMDEMCQGTICHEFAHSWFGNLVTCTTPQDMWFNEGGATFAQEVAFEAAKGRSWSDDYYQRTLDEVIRTAHNNDGGYLPLHGVSGNAIYGSTTYDKGGKVWHSLRGYMGDSLFYASMRYVFEHFAFGNIDAVTLRDTLSAVSGMDLTEFFNFHVFGPGFVDYHITHLGLGNRSAEVTVRQLLRGTDTYCRGNRVPITFFSATREKAERLLIFDDSIYTATFELPFEPRYAVLDYHHQLSDACVDDETAISSTGMKYLSNAHFKANVISTGDGTGYLHVGNHYARPTGGDQEGILRINNRYWDITGILPDSADIVGRFHYTCAGYNGANSAYLDQDFYSHSSSLDSIYLLHRWNDDSPWEVVSHKRASGSSGNEGWFSAPLQLGQYTLAVIDTTRLSAAPAQASGQCQLRLTPNPSHNHFKVSIEGHDKKFDLSIFDLTGKNMLQMQGLHNSDTVRHQLPSGTYIVIIKNNFVSLQSQIIVP